MQLSLSNQIARKMLSGRHVEPLMQFIARISMLGMGLAVAVLILVLSVMNGFDREFKERILGLVPHVTLNLSSPMSTWQQEQAEFESEESIVRVNPFVSAQALAIRGSQAEPVVLYGLDDKTLRGQFSAYGDNKNKQNVESLLAGEVLIGKRLAQSLKLSAGDSFRVIFVSNNSQSNTTFFASHNDNKTKSLGLKIADIIHTGTELDTVLVIARLEELAIAKYSEVAVDGFQFQVNNIFSARDAVYPALDRLGLSGFLNDWRYQYGNLYTAIQMSRQLVVILLAAIVAIAAFNIFVSLGMSVKHRQKEIAILRGYGLQKIDVQLTFCLQGIYIFLPGFIVGAVVGVILALSAPYLVEVLQLVTGVQFLDPSVYPIDYLPSQIRWQNITLIFFLSLIASILATLIPAWRASRLNPASILS